MTHHRETVFEQELVAHLTANGWLEGDPVRYDPALALYPEDLIGWLVDSQPEQLQKWATFHRGADYTKLVAYVAKLLDQEGSLALLRHGCKDGSARFQLCQFKPSHGFNPALQQRYAQVRCRVVRQVHYAQSNQNSIDVVLFVNGIPVATLELKTDFTQSVHDAIRQYRQDRPVRDPQTRQEEPLLAFKRRALVHFAVSTDQVYMTTRLDGPNTRFLPFNQGDDQGAGNPPNPNGYRTAYLWEQVLQRDAFLDILGRFINLERKEEEGADGRKRIKETLVFPRYHQWQVVNQLVAAAAHEGPGHSYLVQHSAGSGKSNSIAWLAHRLATLHNAYDTKVFDGVIVLTDRTVLDSQLQETIYNIEHKTGVVQGIDDAAPKSHQLLQALTDRKPIVVVTIQTFPALLELLQRDGSGHAAGAPNFAARTYALIVDEAHSSQSAGTSHKLKQLLGSTLGDDASGADGSGEGAGSPAGTEGEPDDPDREFSGEDALAAAAQARLLPPNTSVFAFTATPKAKTLELFGRKDPANPAATPQPFHVYAMRQAIEEEYILDVLQNFTPYQLAFRLAHNGRDYDDAAVDKSEGLKQLAQWVRHHPTNIERKSQVILDHFTEVVAHEIGGLAKAMVVTASRKEAVRYKLELDRQIAARNLPWRALVAFSGEVNDPASGTGSFFGPFTETNLNPDLHGRSLRQAFATPAYRLLVVANKFQTGFDQPLLAAMYVDKRLAGVNTVQTLSRLNRTCPGKQATYVVDFVNRAEEVLEAFAPYYRTATLAGVSDPNLVHALQARLDAAQLYTDAEVRAFAQAALDPKGTQARMQAAIAPAVERFRRRLAEAGDNQLALDQLTILRKDMASFVRAYEFLAQIYDYGDAELEGRCLFFKHLLPWLKLEHRHQPIDLSAVELTHYRLSDQGQRTLRLQEGPPLPPLTAVGSAQPHDPDQARLSEIVAQMNELFAGDLTDADLLTYAQHISGRLLENETLARQAATNTKEQFAIGDYQTVFLDTIYDALGSYQRMAEQVLATDTTRDAFARLILDLVWAGFQAQRQG